MPSRNSRRPLCQFDTRQSGRIRLEPGRSWIRQGTVSPLKKETLNLVRMLGLYLALNVGTFLMLKIIVQYTAFDDQAGFLAFKQDYLHIAPWKVAFYLHVFSSIFTLVAGFTQFSSEILKNHRGVHRFMGRFYAWNVILINFPSGLIMAVYANGGLPTKFAFVLLDSLWLWFTVRAVLEVRSGNINAHREYMIRSYALTFSAVTLRTWRLVLATSFDLDPTLLYQLDAWLGFVPNLICAEWLIARARLRAQRLNSTT